MSLKLGTQNIAGISQNTKYNAHSLFDFKWSDHVINDMNWLKADTGSWHSGDTYTDAYNHLVADIEGIISETETIGGYTVTFYRATDGHKIVLADSIDEANVNRIYRNLRVAWYYILDTTNRQFKLPRTQYGFKGIRESYNAGDYIDESLPNITGAYSQAFAGFSADSYSGIGAITKTSQTSSNVISSSSGAASILRGTGFTFDASRSSSTYQDDAPVQERATQMYLYFYVGDYSQTAIEQTAGLNSELFNDKADVNLTNINSSCKALDGQWVMSYLQLAQNVSIAGSSSNAYSLASYLPDDNYDYEVIVTVMATTGTTSGNNADILVGNNLYTGIGPRICYAVTRTNASVAGAGQCILVVPNSDRRVVISQAFSVAATLNLVRVSGYRRIGTNS